MPLSYLPPKRNLSLRVSRSPVVAPFPQETYVMEALTGLADLLRKAQGAPPEVTMPSAAPLRRPTLPPELDLGPMPVEPMQPVLPEVPEVNVPGPLPMSGALAVLAQAYMVGKQERENLGAQRRYAGEAQIYKEAVGKRAEKERAEERGLRRYGLEQTEYWKGKEFGLAERQMALGERAGEAEIQSRGVDDAYRRIMTIAQEKLLPYIDQEAQLRIRQSAGTIARGEVEVENLKLAGKLTEAAILQAPLDAEKTRLGNEVLRVTLPYLGPEMRAQILQALAGAYREEAETEYTGVQMGRVKEGLTPVPTAPSEETIPQVTEAQARNAGTRLGAYFQGKTWTVPGPTGKANRDQAVQDVITRLRANLPVPGRVELSAQEFEALFRQFQPDYDRAQWPALRKHLTTGFRVSAKVKASLPPRGLGAWIQEMVR